MAEHGSVYEIDADLLERIRPDVVITQAVCDVCAVPTAGVREVLEGRGLESRIASLDAHTIEGILETIELVGEAAGAGERAAALVRELRGRLDAVAAAVAGAPRPRVLAIEWLEPPFTPGHWVPEMIELAGARNLAGDPGRPSRETTWEALSGLRPDVLLLMPCGYGLDAARADADARADRLLASAPEAIEGGRAFVVDASAYFNRSGPRFVTGVEILAGLLHPDRWEAPDPAAAAAWKPPR